MERPSDDPPAGTGPTDQAGPAAIGARLRRLSERIDRDAARLYQDLDVRFEQRWFGVINLLAASGPQTVGELAAALGVSHASVSQVRTALGDAGLISWTTDAEDARQRRLQLSPKGMDLVEQLTPIWHVLNAAAVEINVEAGDALAALTRLEAVLVRSSLYERSKSKLTALALWEW
jgi:DNA-binding MarR family transcriptional regulator